MSETLWDKIKSLMTNRLIPVGIVLCMVFLLVGYRLFTMQMVTNTETNVEQNTSDLEKTAPISATRGDIYDCNGKLLAYNELQYNLEMYDSASLSTNEAKNAMIYELIQLMREFGYEREFRFYIVQNADGELEFTVSDDALLRFKKNAYGLTSVSKLTEEQKNATAQEVFDFLRFGNQSAKMFQIDEAYSIEDALEIMAYRYQLFILYPSYSSFRLVSDISNEAKISFYENTSRLPGIEITRTSKRVYNDAEYFAHIIGYVGLINGEELATYKEIDSKYSESSIVGKLGVEKSFENYLSGIDGEMTILVNSRGQVVSKTITREPISGNDVYLTIDGDLQIGCYNVLKRNIAAILYNAIVDSMDYGSKGEDATDITIPIYEVYYAFFNNHLIDTDHIQAEDASEKEQALFALYQSEEEKILALIFNNLDSEYTKCGSEISKTEQDYLDFIYEKLGSSGWNILNTALIDTESREYQEFAAKEMSLSKFLQYAITQGWIYLDKLNIGSDYYDTKELYSYLHDYILTKLQDDSDYESHIYRTLIMNYTLKGRDLCLILFDQGVLKEDPESYRALANGTLSAYNFVKRKIKLLEITPAMLALEPCSGSVVITDPDTAKTLALVSYPSYDNNYLTNSVDMEYYNRLLQDKSYPMVNRATTSKTTTGSTFKPLTSIAGLTEKVISVSETIYDKGIFEKVNPSPKCWRYPLSHGSINVSDAIKYSCNYFFYELGYRMSLNEHQVYIDALGIKTIQKYAKLFGLGDKSGLEVSEAMPSISNNDAVRTAIGYGHSFAPSQIARYLTTLTNEGTCYNLTLLDQIVTQDGELYLKNTATIHNSIEAVAQSSWDAVKLGMYRVVNANSSSLRKLFDDLSVKVAGKTGTAQVSLNHPNNALFISFAPYSDPEICVAVVIPNGYSSTNAAYVAREIYGFYFDDENREALLSGNVIAGNISDTEYID